VKYVALGQFRQVALELAPMVGEYLPASHDRQVSMLGAAVVGEYLPGGQAVHVCASSYE
jgi:hypothetical protein